MTRPLFHYGFHFLLPLALALVFYQKNWKKAYLIMLAGMLIDLDHLLADPIFDPDRCSINYHSLHSYWAIGIYALGLITIRTRAMAMGLLAHIVAAQVDCWLL